MANNLERMWEVRDSLPYENRDQFTHQLLGSLSVVVAPEVWEESLKVAKTGLEADRG